HSTMSPRAHLCLYCTTAFPRVESLRDHVSLSPHSTMSPRAHLCLYCTTAFPRVESLRDHVVVHMTDEAGGFMCPSCDRAFADFLQLKKHVRGFHSEKIFQCSQCDKAFCRPDKLKLHMLRHSDQRDFLCSSCGKQFKRKDKLKEHMQRMHNPERELLLLRVAVRPLKTKRFRPKVAPHDFESFTFKCRVCMMGFRRRGMLVNHLSKRHPEMPLAEVPELTLPIIKPNRDYFCQYCDKVYKSASKRKSHILKNHPGYDLPPSIRKLRLGLTGLGGGAGLPGCVTGSGGGDAEALLCTHTQLTGTLTGTVASAPVCCPHCSKQYSSKAKMVQHIRKKHTEQLLLMQQQQQQQQLHHSPATTTTTTTTTTTPACERSAFAADLLTQAMSELSQSLAGDFRPGGHGEFQRVQFLPVASHAAPTPSPSSSSSQQQQHIQLQVVQCVAASPNQSTVDLSQIHDSEAFTHILTQVLRYSGTHPSPPLPPPPSPPRPPPSLEGNQQREGEGLGGEGLGGATAHSPSPQQQQQQYLASSWGTYDSEIEMVTIPQAQFVITETTSLNP
ncbi:unnamed protein product, partial [Lampetra fluviatilis]